MLGFVPYSIINPIYNGTKSFVHYWTKVQRTQVTLAYPNMRVIEIVPPSVGTDLHRERSNPDDNKKEKGAKNSLTIQEYMTEIRQGFEQDKDEIGAGSAHSLIQQWNDAFGERYNSVASNFKRE